MNIMWMPNRRLGHYGRTNSGVVGDTHPSKSEMADSLNGTRLKGIMVVEFIFSNSLIIHQVKRKEITTEKEVWIPRLN